MTKYVLFFLLFFQLALPMDLGHAFFALATLRSTTYEDYEENDSQEMTVLAKSNDPTGKTHPSLQNWQHLLEKMHEKSPPNTKRGQHKMKKSKTTKTLAALEKATEGNDKTKEE